MHLTEQTLLYEQLKFYYETHDSEWKLISQGNVAVSHERILFFKPDIFIVKFFLVSKKISICWRSFFVITWAESFKVREKIDSRFFHNKNSSMIADEMRSIMYPKAKHLR